MIVAGKCGVAKEWIIIHLPKKAVNKLKWQDGDLVSYRYIDNNYDRIAVFKNATCIYKYSIKDVGSYFKLYIPNRGKLNFTGDIDVLCEINKSAAVLHITKVNKEGRNASNV